MSQRLGDTTDMYIHIASISKTIVGRPALTIRQICIRDLLDETKEEAALDSVLERIDRGPLTE